MHSAGSTVLWVSFLAFVFLVFFIDLFLLGGRKSHRISTKKAFSWTLVWLCCALLFNAIIWFYLKETMGPLYAKQKSLEFLTGYIIEESLSVDNMFMILAVFQFFKIPAEYQRRVLLYGVLGAFFMRFIFIITGSWLIQMFHWVLYIFGVLMIFTGIKMLLLAEDKKELKDNFLIVWLQRHIRITHEFFGEHFFVKQKKLWYATPLFLALVLVEFSDLIFALDSIPAIFAITTDPFIVFTSNIFAIMGLRALYFLLANMAARFHLLKYGIAFVLMFVGFKMLIEPWYDVPIILTLAIIASTLTTASLISVLQKRKP